MSDFTPSDPDAIRTDIERTRAELADTVDALAAKADVKAQASHKVEAAKDAAKDKVSSAAASAKAATPEPVQQALGTVAEKAGPAAHRVDEVTAPHRGKILAGVGVAVLVFVVVRRRRAG